MMCSHCLKEEKVIGDVALYSVDYGTIPLDEDLISQEIGNSFT